MSGIKKVVVAGVVALVSVIGIAGTTVAVDGGAAVADPKLCC